MAVGFDRLLDSFKFCSNLKMPLIDEGVSIKAIVDELQVSKSTVLSAKSKTENFGPIIRKPDTKKPKITTEDENRPLVP